MAAVLISADALQVLAAAARSTIGLRRSIVGDRRASGKPSTTLDQLERETAAIERAIDLADAVLGKRVPIG